MNLKLICILNPLSADGRCAAECPFVEELLTELEVDFRIVRHEGDLKQASFNLLKECAADGSMKNCVIAGMGGDGTHHALINGMMAYKTEHKAVELPPYAVIPLGTGNNIAKSFGFDAHVLGRSGSIKKAVETAVKGSAVYTDLGEVGGLYFLDAFAAGADAFILAGRDRDKAALQGRGCLYAALKGYPLYIYNGLRGIALFKPVQGMLEVDGKECYSGKIFNIVVNNTAVYGGEFELTPGASATDGKLDAAVFRSPSAYFAGFMKGYRHITGRSSAPLFSGEKIRIILKEEVPSLIDGEVFSPGCTFEIRTLKNEIRVMVDE